MSAPKSNAAQALHRELAELEQRQAALAQALAQRRAENERQRALLAELEARGWSQKTRRVFKLGGVLLVLVALGAWIGHCAHRDKAPQLAPLTRVLERKLTPHLLITSVPEGARVIIDGKPAGQTPLLQPVALEERRYRVRVEAPGLGAQESELRASETGGAHVHAVLTR